MAELSDVHEYLRWRKSFPTVWCPGCGDGTIMNAIVRAIQELKIPKDDVAMVSGIGCSSRMPVYLDFNTLHTTHGRALPFATGIKLARPNMKVIVISGDGDALAIGGNHFIHSARRNIGITMIMLNNAIYGMTGGQVAPTTPKGAKAHTAPMATLTRPSIQFSSPLPRAQHLSRARQCMLSSKRPISSKKRLCTMDSPLSRL